MVVVLVGDTVSVNNVVVCGNVDPYEHLGSFFDGRAVSTLVPALLLLVSMAIFKNVL